MHNQGSLKTIGQFCNGLPQLYNMAADIQHKYKLCGHVALEENS